MTGVELTEAEAATILEVANDASTTEEVLNAVAQIVAARLAPVEAERDSFRARLAQAIGVPEPVAADLAKATHLTVRINADCAAHLVAMDAKGTPATEVVREAISLHRFGQEGGITRLAVEAADEKARAEAAEAEVARLTAELKSWKRVAKQNWEQAKQNRKRAEQQEARAAKAERRLDREQGCRCPQHDAGGTCAEVEL